MKQKKKETQEKKETRFNIIEPPEIRTDREDIPLGITAYCRKCRNKQHHAGLTKYIPTHCEQCGEPFHEDQTVYTNTPIISIHVVKPSERSVVIRGILEFYTIPKYRAVRRKGVKTIVSIPCAGWHPVRQTEVLLLSFVHKSKGEIALYHRRIPSKMKLKGRSPLSGGRTVKRSLSLQHVLRTSISKSLQRLYTYQEPNAEGEPRVTLHRESLDIHAMIEEKVKSVLPTFYEWLKEDGELMQHEEKLEEWTLNVLAERLYSSSNKVRRNLRLVNQIMPPSISDVPESESWKIISSSRDHVHFAEKIMSVKRLTKGEKKALFTTPPTHINWLIVRLIGYLCPNHDRRRLYLEKYVNDVGKRLYDIEMKQGGQCAVRLFALSRRGYGPELAMVKDILSYWLNRIQTRDAGTEMPLRLLNKLTLIFLKEIEEYSLNRIGIVPDPGSLQTSTDIQSIRCLALVSRDHLHAFLDNLRMTSIFAITKEYHESILEILNTARATATLTVQDIIHHALVRTFGNLRARFLDNNEHRREVENRPFEYSKTILDAIQQWNSTSRIVTLELPKDENTLRLWGATHHHCIAGYAVDVLHRQTILVGLHYDRGDGPELCYCMELNLSRKETIKRARLGQIRGAYNADITDEGIAKEIASFLKKHNIGMKKDNILLPNGRTRYGYGVLSRFIEAEL